MSVLKYFDSSTNKWEALSVLGGSAEDLKISQDILHLVDKNGNKMGKGVDTADISGAAAKIDTKIVSELPTTDISATSIYLVRDVNATDTKNEYNEYMYINNNWERLDATQDSTDVDQITDSSIGDLF